MPDFIRLDWGNWLYGLFAGFIGGGAGAVVTGFTASALDPDKLALGSSRFFVLIGVVFLAHGCISTAMFLQQNPLPQKLTVTDETATKTVTASSIVTESAKTTTTVEGGK
jgi:uncharacterized membrane protein HdeD (DUF308 family)